jgi:hypothetical protein
LYPVEEAPGLHPEAALLRAPAAWDAWDAAHPDEAADAEHQQGLRLEPADAAEKSVDQEPGVPEQHASRRRSELQVAQAVEVEMDAPGLCTPVAVRFAEQSCAAQVVAQQLVLQQQEAWAVHSKRLALLAQKMPELRAVLPDAPEEHSLAWRQPTVMLQKMLRPVAAPREEPQPEARKLPLAQPVLPPVVQRLSDD